MSMDSTLGLTQGREHLPQVPERFVQYRSARHKEGRQLLERRNQRVQQPANSLEFWVKEKTFAKQF